MSEPPPSPMVRRICVVVNPVSGVPARHSLVPRFLEGLKNGGTEVAVSVTEGPGHATELAREAAERGCDLVVAVGGDGTLNEVLNGLPPAGPALATFPAGTSSIIARELGMPFGAEAAARVVCTGRRRRIDAGRANGRRFLMVVGVGWDAHVVERVAAERRGHLGKHRYLLPIARAVLDYRWPELTVALDGRPLRGPSHLAFACNFRRYAAFFRIAPRAEPDDGWLDMVVLREGQTRNCVRWAWGALAGTLPAFREVTCRKGRRLVVDSREPVPWQVDGDPGGVTPVTVTLDAGAVEIIVP